MLGINGIGAAGGAVEPRAPEGTGRKPAPPGPHETDGVEISESAVQAAEATRLVEQATEIAENEERQQRIEEAKRNVEAGAHRVQSIVLEIAGRITGMVG